MENKVVVAIRADSSTSIGSGHIMRCLTLAEQLTNSGAEVFFICLELTGNMIPLIEKKGYVVEIIPHIKVVQDDMWKKDLEYTKKIIKCSKKQIHWLIVDHYGLDNRWENGLRSYTKKIMVIDDLANRKHDCDLLLDQNFYMDIQTRYDGLQPAHCRTLLGPQYALLRQEFYENKRKVRVRDGIVKRIVVFFGGSDSTNETMKTLQVIQLLNKEDIYVDVIVGNINPYKEQIRNLCNVIPNTNFYCQINNMAEMMANADLAIGAGGATTWERCYLGLPALVVVVAENQRKVTEAVAAFGAIVNLGYGVNLSTDRLFKVLQEMIASSRQIQLMSRKALDLMENKDLLGVDLVIQNMETIHAVG